MPRVLILTGLNRPWVSLHPNPHVPSPCFWVPLVGPLMDGNLVVPSQRLESESKRLIFLGLHSQLSCSRDSARNREIEIEIESKKKKKRKKKRKTWGPKL